MTTRAPSDYVDPSGWTWRQDPVTWKWQKWDGTTWIPTDGLPPGYQPAATTTPAPQAPQPGIAVPPGYVLQKKKRKKWPWVLGTLGGIVVLIIVLVVVAVGKAVNDLNTEQAAHAISQAQFDQVQLGITQDQLTSELGKSPENSQEFVQQGILGSGQINNACVYYNQTGHTFGHYYQFCFENNALNSKNAY